MVTTSLCFHVLFLHLLLLLCLLRGLCYLCSSSDSPFSPPASLYDPLSSVSFSNYHTISLGHTRRCHRISSCFSASSNPLLLLRPSFCRVPSQRRTDSNERNEKGEGGPRSGHCCQACLPFSFSFSPTLPLSLFPSLLVPLPLLSRQCSALDIRASCAANAVDVGEADGVYE